MEESIEERRRIDSPMERKTSKIKKMLNSPPRSSLTGAISNSAAYDRLPS